MSMLEADQIRRRGPRVLMFFTTWSFIVLLGFFGLATLASARRVHRDGRERRRKGGGGSRERSSNSKPSAAAPIPLLDAAAVALLHVALPSSLIVVALTWLVLVPMLLNSPDKARVALTRAMFFNFVSYCQHGKQEKIFFRPERKKKKEKKNMTSNSQTFASIFYRFQRPFCPRGRLLEPDALPSLRQRCAAVVLQLRLWRLGPFSRADRDLALPFFERPQAVGSGGVLGPLPFQLAVFLRGVGNFQAQGQDPRWRRRRRRERQKSRRQGQAGEQRQIKSPPDADSCFYPVPSVFF